MPRRTLTGKRVLITGASQGIGRALAVAAARAGARVLAAARTNSLLVELANEVRAAGGVLETVAADVATPAGRDALRDAAVAAFGGLDILVNNAGIGATGHFVECDPASLRAIFEVNLFGTCELTRLCLPLLRAGERPLIVNVSSVLGRRGYPARSFYSASKFAVQGWSDALRAELSPHGIGVLVVNPGLTRTNFSENMLERSARLPLDHLRGMSAEAVADATVRAIERGKAEITLTFNGKLLLLVTRFAPWVFEVIARRKIRRLFAAEIVAREQRKKAAG